MATTPSSTAQALLPGARATQARGSRVSAVLSTDDILATFHEPGALGFYNWLQFFRPRINKADNQFTPIEL